jgi:tetratricopeptide (TPR) repeat protein
MDAVDPLNPQDAWAYNNLGQYERAIQDYDEAIRLNPQVAMLYYNRGGSYEALGKTKEVERDFQKAKELGRGVRFAESGVGPRRVCGALSDHLPVWTRLGL